MSNILVQTKIQSLVFKKYQNVVAVSHYKNDVLINTFYLNAQLFKNIQLTLMHFRDALTRIKAYHDKDLFRLFPEMRPVNPPTVNTDNKEVSMMGHEPVGVVESAGEALCPCGFDGCDNDCNYDKEATAIGRVDKICKDCGYPDDYCICDTCADCGVITKTDDPANYRHEVRYAPIDDDFDDVPF